MPDTDVALTQIDTLVQVALRLAGTAASGRIALAKLAANLDKRWLPAPWEKTVWPELERALSAEPPPLPFSTVEGVLREAWSVRKVSEELDSLDPEPVAVRWTSQVHRGVREGAPVAVKVLRPGLAASVRQDLVLLDGLLAPLASAFPGADIHGLLTEARERVMDEFDLDNEASLQRRFWRALRRDGLVVVPEPVTDLSHEQVLVSEWIDGRPLSGGVDWGFDAAAGTLLRFVLGGIRAGLVHCDLDLDDILVLDDGRLAVLDYGAVAVVAEQRADQCLEVVEAFRAGDAARLGAGLQALGLIGADHGQTALTVSRTALGPLGEAAPSRLDVQAVSDCLPRLESVGEEAVSLLLAGRLEPGDLYPARGIGQLFSLIARTGASGAWPALVADALRDGWS